MSESIHSYSCKYGNLCVEKKYILRIIFIGTFWFTIFTDLCKYDYKIRKKASVRIYTTENIMIAEMRTHDILDTLHVKGGAMSIL